MSDRVEIRRALISVSDKDGAVDLALALAEMGVEIVSSSSTAEALAAGGVQVTPVSEVTGYPEMLGGRVKTLHPAVHAGILADRRNAEHLRQLEEHGVLPIDLVVVNLYPFKEAARSGAAPDEVVEQIDVGGPAMVRAAAKNFESVAVVVNPQRYSSVVEELRREKGLSRETRMTLAAEAFAHTTAYDAAIAQWFAELSPDAPERMFVTLEKRDELRYGENPHQRAAVYTDIGGSGLLWGAEVLQGKEMSFNNWLDAEAALTLVSGLPTPSAVIVKHHNPCGAALAGSQEEAYRRARACDPISAFGGVVAFNTEVEPGTVEAMSGVFTEVVVAPGFTRAAREDLAPRDQLRLLQAWPNRPQDLDIRFLPGGALVQAPDAASEGRDDMAIVTTRQPTPDQWVDLLFAWKVASRVKSNSIVLAKDRATVGIGAGQMSRVDSVDIACWKAGDRARGSVMASDAFFPFRDGIEHAARFGVAAVIHPGGSVRDAEVLEAAQRHGMTMVLTGRRHFRH